MKTIYKALVVTALAALLAACAGSQEPASVHVQCTYPNSDSVAAPGWICDEPVESVYRQAYGYARSMAGGHGMMRSVAETEARAALSRQFISEVTSELKRHASDTFSSAEGQTEALDQIELVMNEFSSMEITNARIIRSQPGPNQGLFVLVGISERDYAANLQRISQNMPSDSDIYRRFLQQEARNRLNEEHGE